MQFLLETLKTAGRQPIKKDLEQGMKLGEPVGLTNDGLCELIPTELGSYRSSLVYFSSRQEERFSAAPYGPFQSKNLHAETE